jgi:uncharacterized protein (UPF0335 family)
MWEDEDSGFPGASYSHSRHETGTGRTAGLNIEEERMQVQFNSDKNIAGVDARTAELEGVLTDQLDRFSERITRLEVHLSDVNSHKSGQDDKRCMLEARLAGRDPVVVTHNAATIEEAVDGAAGKLKRALDSTLGRLSEVDRNVRTI